MRDELRVREDFPPSVRKSLILDFIILLKSKMSD